MNYGCMSSRPAKCSATLRVEDAQKCPPETLPTMMNWMNMNGTIVWITFISHRYKSRVITCFCSPKQRFHSLLDLFHDGFTSFLLPRSIKQSYLRRRPNEACCWQSLLEKLGVSYFFWEVPGSPRMSKGLDNFRCFGFSYSWNSTKPMRFQSAFFQIGGVD